MTTEQLDDLEFSIPMAQIVAGRTKALAVRTIALPTTGARVPPNQWVECDTVDEAQAIVDWATAHR